MKRHGSARTLKLAMYSINVFCIQVLGKINRRLMPYPERWTRPDRLCYCEYEDSEEAGLGMVSHISCCDCGASHYLWKANNGIYGVPVRPEGYSYKLRLPVDTAFASDEEAGKWNENR